VRNRVAALAAALIVLAFLGTRAQGPSDKADDRATIKRIFPTYVESFRLTSRRDDPDAYEWFTYGDAGGDTGDTIDVLVNYGALAPHDSISCYWARAQDASWRRLVTLATATAGVSVVFDVAVFTDARATMRLVASTECWEDGCRESMYEPARGWFWPRLDILRGKAKTPIPVAITIASPRPMSNGVDLLQSLKNFVGILDLSKLCELSAAR
jgi:hypothetical protein